MTMLNTILFIDHLTRIEGNCKEQLPSFSTVPSLFKFGPSLFADLRSKQCRAVTMAEIADQIRRGDAEGDIDLRVRTEQFRYLAQAGLADRAHAIKQSVPAFTPAVSCRGGRRAEQIEGLTGYSLCDFDHLEGEGELERCRALLAADPHVGLCYTTLSGRGLRVIFAYAVFGAPEARASFSDTALYREIFTRGNEYFARLIGHEYDAKCKDRARLSALAYDPDAHFAPDALAFGVVLKSCAPRVVQRGERAGTYHAGIDEAAEAAMEVIGRQGLAYVPHHHNEYIANVCYLLNRYGVPQQDAERWATAQFSDYGQGNVRSIVHSCYANVHQHGTLPLPGAQPAEGAGAGKEKRGAGKTADLNAVEAMLAELAEFRYNTVSDKTEFRAPQTKDKFTDLSDRDISSFWRRLNTRGLPVHLNVVRNILRSDFTPSYNPFEAYIDSLPEWDGVTDHIGALADTVHVREDGDLWRRLFRKWFVAILPTLVDPEVYNEGILVLIGDQGIFKTTWLRRLLPPQLRIYYYNKLNGIGMNKDDLAAMTTNALVCLEEIDKMRPEDLNQLKGIVTNPVFQVRLPYRENPENRLRTASLCGSGNNRHFLIDTTGNRRWLVFDVASIDSPHDYPIDYAALYGQAKALWKAGFDFHFDGDDYHRLHKHNTVFEPANIEQELIMTYFAIPAKGQACEFFTTADIINLLSLHTRLPLTAARIGTEMKNLGFQRCARGGKRGYLVIVRTQEEIRASMRATAPSDDDPDASAPDRTNRPEEDSLFNE